MAWAVFMAGGSCPQLPAGVDKGFLSDAAKMDVVPSIDENYEQLVKSGTGNIIFYHSVSNFTMDIPVGKYELNYINPSTGERTVISSKLKIDGGYSFDTQKNKSGVYWFKTLK
jgi:hypothetical protein